MSVSDSLEVNHWTDLPRGMSSDFVSNPGDYDYPFYISEKEEWAYIKDKKNRSISAPFFIMELNRLVPHLQNNFVRFHVLNMPHVMVNKIDIMGFVTAVSENAKCHVYQIDDGTGSIKVYYNKDNFAKDYMKRKKIDDKYKDYALNINSQNFRGQECPKSFPNPRPNFSYPSRTSIREQAILEHKWYMETEKGLLGKFVRRCDYIHVQGYCNLDRMFRKRPTGDVTLLDLCHSKLTFFAMKVSCVTEHDYNERMSMWMENFVKGRYDENPKKEELVPKPSSSFERK